MADEQEVRVGEFVWWWHESVGWYNDEDDPAWVTETALLDEIERLRAENEALRVASHEAMWNDTLIPIAEALGVGLDDEHGVPRRQFQMVEAIIKQARHG